MRDVERNKNFHKKPIKKITDKRQKIPFILINYNLFILFFIFYFKCVYFENKF